MKNKRNAIILFVAGFILLFIILGILNIPRSMSLKDFQTAVAGIMTIEDNLAQKKIDWFAVENNYNKSVMKMVLDTDRFTDDIRLNSKVNDAIAEGKSGMVDHVQAVILSRTLLRACLYQIDALMLPLTEPEKTMPLVERKNRIDELLKPVYRFLETTGTTKEEIYKNLLQERYAVWTKEGKDNEVKAFDDAVNAIISDLVLDKLNQWRAMDKENREQRLQAVILQAEMRQIFHIPYTTFSKIDKVKAWITLTEFTKLPSEMNDMDIEQNVRLFAADLLPMISN